MSFIVIPYENTNVYKFTKDYIILEQQRQRQRYSDNKYHIFIKYSGNKVNEIKSEDTYIEKIDGDYHQWIQNKTLIQCIQQQVDASMFPESVIEHKYLDKENQVRWNDNTLTIKSTLAGIVYEVKNIYDTDDKVFTFIDPDYIYQPGDCRITTYILNGKHLLVWNEGGVCSVVIILCYDKCKET
jgi:hypothetical protein